MKKTKTVNRKFTLIELLVVISIIALLCGLLFPAIHAVRTRAKEVKAKTLANAIALACKNYEATYGMLPVEVDTTSDQKILNDSEFDELIQILTCREGPGGTGMIGNARNVKFLEPTATFGPTGTYYLDPFEERLIVVMDCDYSGDVTLPSSLSGSVFVYSKGANKQDNNGSKTGGGDDIASWH